jgi:hypothetical protein
MSDGKTLTANHKTQVCPFKPGDDVEYEVKGSNSYGSWGTVKKPSLPGGSNYNRPYNSGGDSSLPAFNTQHAIIYQNALGQANTLLATQGKKDAKVGELLSLADQIGAWVISKASGEEKKEESKDLPF